MDERKNGHREGALDPSSVPALPLAERAKHVRYGGPSKLTPQRQEMILECLRKGYSMQATAALTGIAKSTIYRWLRKAREGNEKYTEFLLAMETAAAEFEVEAVDAIVEAGKKGSWQAYMTLLERKHPERWGKRTVTRHEGHEGGPVEFSLNMTVGKDPIQVINIDGIDDDRTED